MTVGLGRVVHAFLQPFDGTSLLRAQKTHYRIALARMLKIDFVGLGKRKLMTGGFIKPAIPHSHQPRTVFRLAVSV